jgi:hypothetical protein
MMTEEDIISNIEELPYKEVEENPIIKTITISDNKEEINIDNRITKDSIFKIEKVKKINKWSLEDDQKLRDILKNNIVKKLNWKNIASNFSNKNFTQCYNRFNRIKKTSYKGKWKEEEDADLLKYYKKYGPNWNLLEKLMGNTRTPKQIRDRYMNTLDPNLNKRGFNEEEEICLLNIFKKMGKKWSKIASLFPGRTGEMIKNKYFSMIRKNKIYLPNDNIDLIDKEKYKEKDKDEDKEKDKDEDKEKDNIDNVNDKIKEINDRGNTSSICGKLGGRKSSFNSMLRKRLHYYDINNIDSNFNRKNKSKSNILNDNNLIIKNPRKNSLEKIGNFDLFDINEESKSNYNDSKIIESSSKNNLKILYGIEKKFLLCGNAISDKDNNKDKDEDNDNNKDKDKLDLRFRIPYDINLIKNDYSIIKKEKEKEKDSDILNEKIRTKFNINKKKRKFNFTKKK